MSLTTKRVLFAIGCLIAWFGFITAGGTIVNMVVSGLAGWFMGGLIYQFSKKVFPDARDD